jgi:hypothetical protein
MPVNTPTFVAMLDALIDEVFEHDEHPAQPCGVAV